MVGAVARELISFEEPVLAGHRVSMWGYIVLCALAEQPVRIRADRCRIISVLDELQQSSLIQRQPDPADRRVHQLSLTPAGDKLRLSVQSGIRRNEERLLAHLPDADRAAFLRSLQALDKLYRARLAE